MNWRINNQGQYVRGDFVIEIMPHMDEIKPYYLFHNGEYVGNYSTLDIAKRMGVL